MLQANMSVPTQPLFNCSVCGFRLNSPNFSSESPQNNFKRGQMIYKHFIECTFFSLIRNRSQQLNVALVSQHQTDKSESGHSLPYKRSKVTLTGPEVHMLQSWAQHWITAFLALKPLTLDSPWGPSTTIAWVALSIWKRYTRTFRKRNKPLLKLSPQLQHKS